MLDDERFDLALPHLERMVAATVDGSGHVAPSSAASQLIEALFALARYDEAAEWLERIASAPEATSAERMRAADELFFREYRDASIRLYEKVLVETPDHAGALLRLGQVRAWSNDPSGALPYLERRLAVSSEDVGTVCYELGEVYWALDAPARARAIHEQALSALAAHCDLPGASIEHRTRYARVLARLGRWREARSEFAALIEEQPENTGLLFDYADALIGDGAVAEAGDVLERAEALGGRSIDLLRARGRWLVRNGDPVGAAAEFGAALELRGPDAGLYAERASALDLAGDWTQALEMADRWVDIQPGSVDAREFRGSLADRLSDFTTARLMLRGVGDDEVFESDLVGSVLFGGGRFRLGASVWLRLLPRSGSGRGRWTYRCCGRGRAGRCGARVSAVRPHARDRRDQRPDRCAGRSDRWIRGVVPATSDGRWDARCACIHQRAVD